MSVGMESLPSSPAQPSVQHQMLLPSAFLLLILLLSIPVMFSSLLPNRSVLDALLDVLWLRRCLMSVMRLGAIPKHVAFIMDGNRRFAKKLKVQTNIGHLQGFKTLEKTLEWCLDLGVNVVSVYAFSIENFKRSEEEVNLLMELFSEKLREFAQNPKFVEKHGIRMKVLGAIEMLPENVQRAIRDAENLTRHNDCAILNVLCPYTSQYEITNAVNLIKEDVKSGLMDVDEIDIESIESRFFDGDCPNLELIVRTSGEVRLSDFMLWQERM
ncbi:hypothetical protein HK096_009517 [Nowakowskiella sp. JEL0078]|nr:hypothetical protein HK096_009517 [Nowakowskiella sp. JEL0078]